MQYQKVILDSLLEKEISFGDLLKKFPEDTHKNVIMDIKSLLRNNLIVEYDNVLFNLKNLTIKKGFVHSTLNNLVWIEEQDHTNEYGLFLSEPKDDLTIVMNKKNAFPGSYCDYVEFCSENKVAFILKYTYLNKKKLLIGKKNYTWHIINNNLYNQQTFIPEMNKYLNDHYGNGDLLIVEATGDDVNIKNRVGNIKDKGSETEIIKILTCLKEKHVEDLSILKNDNKLKEETLNFITIDNHNTKDIDDAISIKKTKDGFKLYVAIANVDQYIPKDSILDKYAKELATTYYMNFDIVRMLDKNITENICSLNIGEKKAVFICEILFDKNGKQQKYDFYESNISVKYKIPYEDVDHILLEDSELEHSYIVNKNKEVEKISISQTPKDLKEQLLLLDNLTDLIKKTEVEIDYWFLKNPDYQLNENGKVDKLFFSNKEDSSKSQKIVENCMLATNIAAANLIKNSMPQIGIFRNQSTKELYEKPNSANYDFENIGHWSLQEETYTHFTSPIRRYCDLVIHRIIKSIIYKKECPYKESEIKEITEILNNKSYLNKQINIKEKSMLIQEYLEYLVENNNFRTKFEIINFNKLGCLFRNKQNIDIFIPMFKINRDIQLYLSEYMEDRDIQKHLDYVNNYWQFKIYLDKYSWLDSKKETTIKIYLKEGKLQNSEEN